ncbi:MAG: DUF4364 family protein [Provencibacterium sp.]|jgi:hypothetical protein|nr:DUF4364 family protein [Provencibacterium sp.]
MNNGLFTAGVLPGAPTNDFEVKFLICDLLYSAGEPVSFDQLATTFQKTGYVNYFEFSALIQEMVQQGHLQEVGKEKSVYQLTEHGSRAAQEFAHTIPLSVRERCKEELGRQLKLGRRMRENQVAIRKTEDGYTITIEIPDIGTPLMNLTLFMPTRAHCEAIQRRFLNDPQYFYKGILSIATGDSHSLGPIVESGENLFD